MNGITLSFGASLELHSKLGTCSIFTKVQLDQIDSIKHELKYVVRIDTSYDITNDSYVIKMYKNDNNLFRSCSYSIGDAYRSYRYFDKDQNEILTELLSEREGILIQQFLFQYSNGRVITKTGFSSGEIGITLSYIYDSNWNLLETKAYRCGMDKIVDFKTFK